MSSDADGAAATVALFKTFYTSDYCSLAASVLFIYDTFIIFDREVAYFWTTKRISGAALLFFANKWISMTVYVMVIVNFAPFPSDKIQRNCSVLPIAAGAMARLQYIPGAAFSALRAYALSRSKLLGLLVAALSLAPFGVNLVIYGYHASGVAFPPFGCLETDNTTPALGLRSGPFNLITYIVAIISRVPLIVADVILIYITWTNLRGCAALTEIQHSKRIRLSDVLFRGGTIYFVILSVINVLHVILSATAVASEDSDNGFSVITIFTSPITAILISRFLLELQEANRMDVQIDPLDSANPYSTQSFISSLGGFVNPARSVWSDGDDDDSIELQAHSPSEAPESKVEGGAQTEVLEISSSTAQSFTAG
ncbi:hypothetical protein OH76DRAFT_1483321 [Lentinus brumalis]|uniref:DUF6533 domain-containing protein n=1 Tax=Lentinus brumalis TaxID=2498619 RepID=A0A371D998_9APHY|nr:hypothetical protein OH76DRAFT_1483321 [Polyporus brumalis]